ncbi:hypothetical protein [Brachyspira hyodysenteriae]|nr:hypothetical protein [Brachyspira hyodysenteriae]MCZ9886785.1 hypothetical protein [Brachyspira hyodysenteriae]MCZ9961764.1 hypothetical protein [Brachyspira hyodysenteriae]
MVLGEARLAVRAFGRCAAGKRTTKKFTNLKIFSDIPKQLHFVNFYIL